MQLFIMRHGQAEDNCPDGEDCHRQLTAQGKLEVEEIANVLLKQQVAITQLLVSPYVRAQQTASIIQQAYPAAVLTTLSLITPSGNARDVHDYIDGIMLESSGQATLIVSHMPLVTYLVAELTHQQHSPVFKTASVAQINYDVAKMTGDLVQFISPSNVT
jgi:phosphohistidine phosphatase